MHFTVIQIIIMFLIGYICLYTLVDRVMKCIEHCATAKAYGRFKVQRSRSNDKNG
jgi:hypothetical protein